MRLEPPLLAIKEKALAMIAIAALIRVAFPPNWLLPFLHSPIYELRRNGCSIPLSLEFKAMLWEKIYDPANAETAHAELVSSWKETENSVFVLRAKTAPQDVLAHFNRLLPTLGAAATLAEDVTIGDRGNQRSGEIWMEVRYDPKHPNAYRHSLNAQPLHTDGSYIPSFPNATLMCCVANAGVGGETTFISGKNIVEALQKNRPDLLAALTSRPIRHARSGDERSELTIDMSKTPVELNWNYYCLAEDLPPQDRAVCDEFFRFLQEDPIIQDHIVAVKLRPGDAVAWKDRQVLHGRNSFEATQESERFLWKCAIDIGQFKVAA